MEKPTKYRFVVVNGKRMPEHRYLMEQHLGRKLKRTEAVHHIDGNKQNNSLKNLQVLTHKEHLRLHREHPELNTPSNKKIMCPNCGHAWIRKHGRPRKLNSQSVLALKKAGWSITAIAKHFSVTRVTVYKTLAE